MKSRKILVLSHGGVSGNDPFTGVLDYDAVQRTKSCIDRLDLRFDLVLGAPCRVVEETVCKLAPGASFTPLTMLQPDGGQMKKISGIFTDLGMLPDPEKICNHPLVHSLDTLSEALVWEIDQKIAESNPIVTLIVIFPPLTQLAILNLRSGTRQPQSELMRELILGDKFKSCEGYLLQDQLDGEKWLGGCDQRFPIDR